MAALSWAIAMVLFKRSGDEVPPLALNYFKNTLGLGLLAVTLVVTGQPMFPDTPGEDVALLIVSGAVGIGLADTLLFHSLNILGAGRSAIVACLYSPLIMLLSFLLLDESLTAYTGLGAALVIGGVLFTARDSAAVEVGTEKTVEETVKGVVLGATSVALMGIAIVVVKPVLEVHSVLWATTLRMLGGAAVLTVFAVGSARSRRQVLRAFVPGPIWKYSVPGSIAGTYVALLFWVSGFKYTTAITASILNQTSTLIVVILATVFLHEKLTRTRVLAVLLGSAGTALTLL